MGATVSLINRCRKLGAAMPSGVDHEIIAKLLTKLIVQEHVNDEDAFEVASEAYAEGFNNITIE